MHRFASLAAFAALGAVLGLGMPGCLEDKTCVPQDNPHLTCQNPQAVVIGGVDTGYVLCGSGAVHRPVAKSCTSLLPREETCVGAPGSTCAADTDCNDGANGHCDANTASVCTCSYGCQTDADCGVGTICQCGDTFGTCTQTSCTTDADCGDGLLCTTYYGGCLGTVFGCQTCADECAADNECGSGFVCGLSKGYRACETPACFSGQ